THARMGNNGLITVAIARGIDQIKPVEGRYTGSSADFIDMQVEVHMSAGSGKTSGAGDRQKLLS
ncbi:hypothetical protein ABTA45_20210, partial [Acinetobacter baumannii]